MGFRMYYAAQMPRDLASTSSTLQIYHARSFTLNKLMTILYTNVTVNSEGILHKV